MIGTFSNRGVAVQKILQALRDAPDVRTSKVEELRNAVASGTYQVDESALADRLHALLP